MKAMMDFMGSRFPNADFIRLGGLLAERVGWHMNGFDSSGWPSTKTMTVANATVTFFRKVINFSIPEGYDVPLYIRIGSPAGQKLRVQLWVNGYQYGKV